jgi:hypothetical protein
VLRGRLATIRLQQVEIRDDQIGISAGGWMQIPVDLPLNPIADP